MKMRASIRKRLNLMDQEYPDSIPEITVKTDSSEQARE